MGVKKFPSKCLQGKDKKGKTKTNNLLEDRVNNI